MQIADKVAVITGGGGGIGGALAHRFAAEGARAVIVVDVDAEAANAVADEIGAVATAIGADLSSEAGNSSYIEQVEDAHGPIDLLCLNAGIARGGGSEAPDADWMDSWNVNVMAHVWATRAALPSMIARGEGYIVTTASAAGLLTNLGAAPYAVTKHAAVGFAEWLSITHGHQGIKVSCLCPQGVRTKMLFPDDDDGSDIGADAVRMQGVVEPEDVADAVVAGVAAEQFLILPHPEVLTYFGRKSTDYDRWLAGMRKLQASVMGA